MRTLPDSQQRPENQIRPIRSFIAQGVDSILDAHIVELQGTVGATAAIDRMTGFNEVIADYPGATTIRSQTGEFTRARG